MTEAALKHLRMTRTLAAHALAILLCSTVAACRPEAGAKKSESLTAGATRSGGQTGADATTPDDPFARIPRVTVEELAEGLRRGSAVAVDVRPAEAYEEQHIPGALSLPEGDAVERGGELPKDKLVVAYCA